MPRLRRLHDRARSPARGGGPKRGLWTGEALGRSRGGLTTKIHLACDGQGRPPGKKQGSAPDTWAQELIRKLLYARRTASISLAESVCTESAALIGVSPHMEEKLDAAVRHGRLWMEKQTAERERLFANLKRAVADRRHRRVRALLKQAKTVTKADTSELENHAISVATDYLTAVTTANTKHLNALLDGLNRLPRYVDPDVFYAKVHELAQAAHEVDNISPQRQAQVGTWRKRAGLPDEDSRGRPRRASRSRKGRLYRQVAEEDQLMKSCPRCGAGIGLPCLADTKANEAQGVPHDERIQPVIDQRQEEQRTLRPWRVYEVGCPDCGRGVDARCATSGGPHRSRVELAKDLTRRREPHPDSHGKR